MLNFKGIFFTTPLFLRGQKSPCLAKVEKETIFCFTFSYANRQLKTISDTPAV